MSASQWSTILSRGAIQIPTETLPETEPSPYRGMVSVVSLWSATARNYAETALKPRATDVSGFDAFGMVSDRR
jgi:hypothetical protein